MSKHKRSRRQPSKKGPDKSSVTNRNNLPYIALRRATEAVAAVAIGFPFTSVTIVPITHEADPEDIFVWKLLEGKKDGRLTVCLYLVGSVAEDAVNDQHEDSSVFDWAIEQAHIRAIRAFFTSEDSPKEFLKITAEDIFLNDSAIESIVIEGAKLARCIVEEHRKAIIEVTRQLLAKNLLTRDEVDEIVKLNPPSPA